MKNLLEVIKRLNGLTVLMVTGVVMALALFTGRSVVISADGIECMVVESANTILKRSGTYCLMEDLVIKKPSQVIQITAPDITLDLNGYTIRYEGKMSSNALAIKSKGQNAVTVKNGSITGFYVGLHASGNNLSFSNLHIHDIRFIGLLIDGGENIKVDGNEIADVSRKQKLNEPEIVYTIGLQVRGNNVTLANNIIRNIYPLISKEENAKGEGVGVLISTGSLDVTIKSNKIVMNKNQQVSDIAIWLAKKTTSKIKDNQITNYATGLASLGNTVAQNNMMRIDNAFFGSEGKETRGIWVGEDVEATLLGNTVLNYQTGIAFMGKFMSAAQNVMRIDDVINTAGAETYGVWLASMGVDAIVQSNQIINFSTAIEIRNQERKHLFILKGNVID